MTAQDILTICVTFEPGVFRDIEIAGSASLYKLAEAIVRAFDFDFDHAFGFYSKLTGNYFDAPVKYELFTDMGEPTEGARSVKKTQVAEAYGKDKAKFLFLFDYGDEWLFKTERTGAGSKLPKTRYPRVAKSEGEAPEQYPQWEE
ncbi:MAG: IS1096 element passenger TnpR family protein [Hyphomicrobiales bacterium]